MRIGIDQDEVLCQWTKRILEWWNEDEGTTWKVSDIKNAWLIEETIGKEAKHFIRSCLRWPEFYTGLDPVEGSVNGMRKLIEAGHDVFVISAVPYSAGISFHGKCQWLRDYMPFFPLKNFIAASRKEMVNVDILLDDGPHNIEAFEKTGRPACLFETTANNKTNSTYRVRHWNEFIQLIERIEKSKEIIKTQAEYCVYG